MLNKAANILLKQSVIFWNIITIQNISFLFSYIYKYWSCPIIINVENILFL